MRPRAGTISILATALGLLAMPAGATAKPAFDVHERSLRLTVLTEGSNGYHGVISTEGHKQVTLTVYKGRTSVELRTDGRVSRRGIEASFGDLAKVSVRFQGKPEADPNPRRRRSGDARPRCSGRPPIFEAGAFHGIVRFHGENDFALIDAKRAPGFVERSFRRVCKRKPPGPLAGLFEELFGKLRIGLLEARARVDGANVFFEASSFDFSSLFGPGTPLSYGFGARLVERGDGMRVVRVVGTEGSDGSYLTGKPGTHPRTVTVVPPKPFLRSAKRLKEPGAPASWSGSLAVRLPGAGLTPLTGPGFKSAVCNRTLNELIAGDRCLRGHAEPGSSPLAALAWDSAQGSGSHSQAFWDARLSWSR